MTQQLAAMLACRLLSKWFETAESERNEADLRAAYIAAQAALRLNSSLES